MQLCGDDDIAGSQPLSKTSCDDSCSEHDAVKDETDSEDLSEFELEKPRIQNDAKTQQWRIKQVALAKQYAYKNKIKAP